MEERSCQLLTEERWTTVFPTNPFEFWQAQYRSPGPPLMAPGRGPFTALNNTFKVTLYADTGLYEAVGFLEIVCSQFKSANITFTEGNLYRKSVSAFQGSQVDCQLNSQHPGSAQSDSQHMEKGSCFLSTGLLWIPKDPRTRHSLSRSLSLRPPPRYCENVSNFLSPAATSLL